MELMVIPEDHLRRIELAIVNACRDARDLRGRPISMGTVDSLQLRNAACVAASIACGGVIWPGDQKFRLPPAERMSGYVEE